MCNCIDRIGKDLLENHNTELRHTIPLTEKGVARVIIATEKWDTKIKKKPLTLVGSYCPFCGEKYYSETDSVPNVPKPKLSETMPVLS